MLAPSRHHLAAALAACLVALPSLASAQTPIVLDGPIPDGTARYFAVPFTVPEGIREIEVRHDDQSEMNILDWGLADPTRFRGWGGGNTEAAVVSVEAASRSYVPGAIPAGTWSLLIGQAKVIERPARYHVEIFLRPTPTLSPQPERRPYAHAPALSTGPRWYAGDFHVHSRESGDASPTLDEVATFARSRGLDFVELSEHNTVSGLDLVGAAQARHPALLFVPGIEVTTYSGHANAIGATRWVDFRVGSADPMVTVDAITAAAASQGAIFSINHPVLNLGDACIGCSWSLREPAGSVGAVELQNGQYSVTGALFYARSVRFWEAYLARGEHVAPIGGSDDHRAGEDRGSLASPIGGPTTMVYATELSVPAILAGVRAGRTVVKLQGPDDPMVELRAGDAAMIGDTVRARRVTLRATVTHGMGSTLSFVRNGEATDPVAVNADPFTATVEVDAPPGASDDRWRCELAVNDRPRVVTGHIWIAATGVAPSPDAGLAVNPTTTSDGCGCRSAPAPGGAGLGALLVAMAAALTRRRGVRRNSPPTR
ncbi:MAG: PHP domain-containing protein [Deltaproteobacteria bacterium]|nr:PHP domain-containing protein [Deltaproteobacteria bacterium]